MPLLGAQKKTWNPGRVNHIERDDIEDLMIFESFNKGGGGGYKTEDVGRTGDNRQLTPSCSTH